MTTIRSTVLKLVKPILAVTPAPLLKLAGILLLLAGSAFAQGIPHNISPVFGPNGQPRPGATISFCIHPANAVPCSNYAQAYNDIALTQLINQTTNPFHTDGLGNVPAFYAAPGIYDYTISGTGIAAPNGPYVINIPIAAGGNATLASVTSTSANPALTGFTRAASGDQRCWRNNANTADLCLSKNAADQLVASAFAGFLLPSAGWSVNTANIVTFTVTNPAAPRSINFGDPGGADSIAYLLAAQAFQGKTFDISLNTLKAAVNTAGHVPRNNGSQYVDAVLGAADLSDGTTGTGAVVRATSPALTTPTINGTVQLNGPPYVVYNTASASTNTSIGSTTMATASGSGNTYALDWYVTQTTLGNGCTTNTVINITFAYTDPNLLSGSTITATYTITNNGTTGPLGQSGVNAAENQHIFFRSAASQTVSYSTIVTQGTCTTTHPSYQIFPIVYQVQ